MENLTFDRETEKNMGKEEAVMNIEATRQRIYMMGANDREFSEIDDILKRLEKNEIKPGEAVEEAMEIESKKQDYH